MDAAFDLRRSNVIVLGIHYTVMHTSELLGMSRSEVLSFESVSSRAGSPVFCNVYLILLAARPLSRALRP